MQYILTQDEMSNLAPKSKLDEAQENFNLVLKAYQNTENCVPLYKCRECPLCSLNIRRNKICDKQELSK
jgi:hypothetical protein